MNISQEYWQIRIHLSRVLLSGNFSINHWINCKALITEKELIYPSVFLYLYYLTRSYEEY